MPRKAGAGPTAATAETQIDNPLEWADGNCDSAIYTRTTDQAKLARKAKKIPHRLPGCGMRT